MSRYLFSTLSAAACLAFVGPSICYAASGADAGGGAATKTKVKATPKAAEVAPAAPAAADAGGGAAGEAPAAVDAEQAPEPVVDEPVAEAPSLADPASLGFAKISHPAGATSVSHAGQTYEAGKDGLITVPLGAVEDLTSHGFVLA